MPWKLGQPGKHWHAEYQQYETQLRDLIEVQKLTQTEAAAILGKNKTTIERWCKRLGLKTQRTGPRSGSGHPEWKGGRRLVGRYWYVWCPDHPHATKQHYVAEHRLVAEQMIGRYLHPREVVHHRDGNPQNNSPENLAVFQTNAVHLQHELTGRIPEWTEHGRQRIAAGVEKAASIRRKSKAGDGRHIPPTDHPTS